MAKKLLLLQTGGTLGMTQRDPTGALAPPERAAELLAALPEAREIADLTVRPMFNLDSSNVGPGQWAALAEAIAQAMDAYDGVVVIHGTDTMVYTATALSFMLANLPKPVILTGAQRPLAAIRSDARTNLISAIELATYDVPEVAIYFGTALYRGNRAKKVSIDDFQAYNSPNFPPLAHVGLKVELRHDLVRRPQGLMRVHARMATGVMALRVVPGLDPERLMPLADGDAQAFVLEAFGAGNVPTAEASWVPFIQRATERGKIVAIASQAPSGAVDLGLYDCGVAAREAGALSCGDMTVEAAVVKLMHLLGELGSAEAARRHLQVPLAGEITA